MSRCMNSEYSEEQKEVKVTVTHLITKGMMMSLAKNRNLVGRIKWGYVLHYFLLSCSSNDQSRWV